MAQTFQSSRDVIIRTERWPEALRFYGTVLGLPVTHESATLVGFDAGGFCLYVEKGAEQGPVFEFLVTDLSSAKQHLLAWGCTILEEDASVPRCYLRDPFGLSFNIGRAKDTGQ